MIAALFGPIKYGILPDHLARSELPAGNALVEGATFIAILLGTIVGGLAARDGSDPTFFALLIIVFSLSCWISSLFIPPTGEAAPNLPVRANIVVSTVDLLKQLREDRRIWWGAIVTCWFWVVGGVALVIVAAAGQERARRHRRGGDALPRHFRDRDRCRLRPCRLARSRTYHPAADGCSAPSCSAFSRSISALPPGASCRPRRVRASPTCSARCAASASALILPGWPSLAACSSCRCSRRCRRGPVSIAAPA